MQNEMFDDDKNLDELLSKAEDIELGSAAWPQTLAELVSIFKDEMMSNSADLDEEKALTLAKRLVARQAHHMGGRQFYLPRDERLRKAIRDVEIWHLYNGRNISELRQKFNLTAQQVYAILREQRQLERERRQTKLFG
ncbi:Mor transcription activator family protein [Pseudidiomarina aestuarii]|uniref:Mor transcription activator family protein n=1 Tax=Pseudidiomarina aestuarii TaxID=624146 RepID=UPI003A9780A4